jgi:hypothetical protein
METPMSAPGMSGMLFWGTAVAVTVGIAVAVAGKAISGATSVLCGVADGLVI